MACSVTTSSFDIRSQLMPYRGWVTRMDDQIVLMQLAASRLSGSGTLERLVHRTDSHTRFTTLQLRHSALPIATYLL
jgi:hypothetical protein